MSYHHPDCLKEGTDPQMEFWICVRDCGVSALQRLQRIAQILHVPFESVVVEVQQLKCDVDRYKRQKQKKENRTALLQERDACATHLRKLEEKLSRLWEHEDGLDT